MPLNLRKLTLGTHVVTSVGWFGAMLAFFAHAAVAQASSDEQLVRSLAVAMGLTTWFVILPLSVASLASGVLAALNSTWGLLRHYWVAFKLLLGVMATGVLMLKLQPIDGLATAAAMPDFSAEKFISLRTSLLVHAAGGLAVLLAAIALGIAKPRGLTPWGVRAMPEQARAAAAQRPRWVTWVGIVAAVLLVLLLLMLIGGGHGPSAHLPGGHG